MAGSAVAPDYLCPACRSALAVEAQSLRCTGCAKSYPVERGIPRFVPRENYSASFGLQWNRHPRTQLDSAVGRPISETRLFETTGWPRSMPGARILECGSGAGRFTEVLCRTGATVYSFDYSEAVDANARNHGGHPGLHLFQGDIFAVPLPEAAFDHVLCLGVLQHTPEPGRAFASLARHVKPGGDLVIDVYRRSLAALLQWKYLLRPLTRSMDPERLYRTLSAVVPALVGPTRLLRRLAGRAGARLSPIVEYSHLGLSPEQNREWALLDTFDMYAPAYDKPQSRATVRRWFEAAGFTAIEVFNGYNGVIGRGRRPLG
jgi:2-polyprenyl-3-methyl-5-hydroxy-6-metoxy-1,4-benzoquinol methylase